MIVYLHNWGWTEETIPTVMCHNVGKETISYFLNKGLEIYSCMLDTIKAFDRLRYDKLFELLIKQDFPPIVILLINTDGTHLWN